MVETDPHLMLDDEGAKEDHKYWTKIIMDLYEEHYERLYGKSKEFVESLAERLQANPDRLYLSAPMKKWLGDLADKHLR